MEVERLRGGWYPVAKAKWMFVEHFGGDREAARVAWGFAAMREKGGEVSGDSIRKALTGSFLTTDADDL